MFPFSIQGALWGTLVARGFKTGHLIICAQDAEYSPEPWLDTSLVFPLSLNTCDALYPSPIKKRSKVRTGKKNVSPGVTRYLPLCDPFGRYSLRFQLSLQPWPWGQQSKTATKHSGSWWYTTIPGDMEQSYFFEDFILHCHIDLEDGNPLFTWDSRSWYTNIACLQASDHQNEISKEKLSALRCFESIWKDWDKCAYQYNNNDDAPSYQVWLHKNSGSEDNIFRTNVWQTDTQKHGHFNIPSLSSLLGA